MFSGELYSHSVLFGNLPTCIIYLLPSGLRVGGNVATTAWSNLQVSGRCPRESVRQPTYCVNQCDVLRTNRAFRRGKRKLYVAFHILTLRFKTCDVIVRMTAWWPSISLKPTRLAGATRLADQQTDGRTPWTPTLIPTVLWPNTSAINMTLISWIVISLILKVT